MTGIPAMTPAHDCDAPQDGLMSAEAARARLVAGACPVTDVEPVSLRAARGRVLAAAQTSPLDVPPHDYSAMDGYALHGDDLGEPGSRRLAVTQTIYAGGSGQALAAGEAARIFTGAPIPSGAAAVVMQEACRAEDGAVVVTGPVPAGENIRRRGEDSAAGRPLLAAGTRLRAQELGLAASVGLTTLPVFRRPRVAVFFTGDELVEPGHPLGPGQIYNANRYSLTGLLEGLGCEVMDLGAVADTLEATRTVLGRAAREADLVVGSGGVSVGDRDYVRLALEALGQLELWRIRVKPGKPVAFGRVDGTPFIGLPGNPVSVFVACCLFVTPFVKRLQGMAEVLPVPLMVTAGFDWPQPGARREYLRARLEAPADPGAPPTATIHPRQGSGVLTSVTWADGLVDVPEGVVIQKGDMVNYYPFEGLF